MVLDENRTCDNDGFIPLVIRSVRQERYWLRLTRPTSMYLALKIRRALGLMTWCWPGSYRAYDHMSRISLRSLIMTSAEPRTICGRWFEFPPQLADFPLNYFRYDYLVARGSIGRLKSSRVLASMTMQNMSISLAICDALLQHRRW
jgi:hypothetical protein